MSELTSSELFPYKLVANRVGYLLFLNKEEDCDKLFSDCVLNALQAIQCIPVLPPDSRAKKCFFLRGLDSYVFCKVVDDILSDMNSRNDQLEVLKV